MLSRSQKRPLLIGLILFVAALYILGTRPRLKQFQGETMGTTYSVSYSGTLFSFPVDDVSSKVEAALEDVNARMSTYRNDSELMAFNRSELNRPFSASPELASLVNRSLEISRLSNGAYDVTVGPLVNLWGFGPQDVDKDKVAESPSSDEKQVKAPEFVEWMLKNYPAELPSREEIAAARAKVGYQNVLVDTLQNTMTRKKDVFVDLSSIAKGYGVDKVAEVLKAEGINSFMVEVGGEVWAEGVKPDGSHWKLGIRGPSMGSSGPAAIVALTGKALATSGDYLNFFEIDGMKYSHTIDPRTGQPEVGRLAEVAVIADTVADADALATMFMVLGDEEGLALANREGIAAYFTYHTETGFDSVASEAFKPYLQQ